MIIIIGLGNPGKKFEKTRHNLGFRIVNQFAKEKKFPKFRFSKKFDSLISERFLNREKIVLAKPKTFMNESGKAIKALIKNYKLKIGNLIVLHDDVDLPLEKIKIVKNHGAAGHKGVQSIIDELKTKNFVRFRIGIQPKTGKPKNVEKFVLQKPSEAGDETKSQRPFTKKEEKILKEVIKRTCQAIEVAIIEGIEKTMNEFNK